MTTRPPRRIRLGAVLLVALLVALVGAVVWAFLAAWGLGGDSRMSIHGWIALIIGFVGSGVIGGGLMWLAFYSSRRGYDDRVGVDEDEEV